MRAWIVVMDTGFLTRVIHADGEERRYAVYVPGDYDPGRDWPVILFLHGAGEGGRDGLLPTEYQLGSAIRRDAARFPGLVAFPQCRSYQWVWQSSDVDHAMRVLDQVRQDFAIDDTRIYLAGVSTGAKATWHSLYRHSQVFAAGLVVAGVIRPRRPDGTRVPDPDPVVPDADGDPYRRVAEELRDTPLWVFHGDDDPVFPVTDAREAVAAFKELGAPVRYTEVAGFGHDVWDIAFYSPEVADWLFAQHRPEGIEESP